jgi:hypothetical protein
MSLSKKYVCWLILWLSTISYSFATSLPIAPLLVLNAYIEGNGRCSTELIEWNRKYNARTIAGDISRVFYYRAISFQEWGGCGQPYMKIVFAELQKIWLIFNQGIVSEAEIEAKEAELINLLFTALASGTNGNELVQRYEQRTHSRLMGLEPERQYFNCTFFGDQPQCLN